MKIYEWIASWTWKNLLTSGSVPDDIPEVTKFAHSNKWIRLHHWYKEQVWTVLEKNCHGADIYAQMATLIYCYLNVKLMTDFELWNTHMHTQPFWGKTVASDLPNKKFWCKVLSSGCPSWHQPTETQRFTFFIHYDSWRGSVVISFQSQYQDFVYVKTAVKSVKCICIQTVSLLAVSHYQYIMFCRRKTKSTCFLLTIWKCVTLKRALWADVTSSHSSILMEGLWLLCDLFVWWLRMKLTMTVIQFGVRLVLLRTDLGSCRTKCVKFSFLLFMAETFTKITSSWSCRQQIKKRWTAGKPRCFVLVSIRRKRRIRLIQQYVNTG